MGGHKDKLLHDEEDGGHTIGGGNTQQDTHNAEMQIVSQVSWRRGCTPCRVAVSSSEASAAA